MTIRTDVNVTSNLAQLTPELMQAVVTGENVAAERLLALSSEDVPLDIGTLLGSGTVDPATDPEDGAAVVYDTPYAARLHEHPEYNFQGGRKGKYLEDPALEHRAELVEIIAETVRQQGGA